MSKIYVIPKQGMMVPDPNVRSRKSSDVRLPAEGKEVDDSTYWQRRLRDGDVTIGTKPKAAKSAKAGE